MAPTPAPAAVESTTVTPSTCARIRFAMGSWRSSPSRAIWLVRMSVLTAGASFRAGAPSLTPGRPLRHPSWRGRPPPRHSELWATSQRVSPAGLETSRHDRDRARHRRPSAPRRSRAGAPRTGMVTAGALAVAIGAAFGVHQATLAPRSPGRPRRELRSRPPSCRPTGSPSVASPTAPAEGLRGTARTADRRPTARPPGRPRRPRPSRPASSRSTPCSATRRAGRRHRHGPHPDGEILTNNHVVDGATQHHRHRRRHRRDVPGHGRRHRPHRRRRRAPARPAPPGCRRRTLSTGAAAVGTR